jgi:hypothetical protein
MTEAEWQNSTHPPDMLRWLAKQNPSERKTLRFLLAARNSGGLEHPHHERNQAIEAALDEYAEGRINRDQLDGLYLSLGMAVSSRFTADNACWWIATTRACYEPNAL